MISALFVQRHGVYFGLPNVDPWDEQRDARLYEGPFPVVAHPPCARWCRLSWLAEARYGLKRGEDSGCFESALSSVRRFGGVLEHPAHSLAWGRFGLPRPSRSGGWTRGFCGGWSCHIEQSAYGHPAKKATWLYAVGCDLPGMNWGSTPGSKAGALVSWCGNRTKSTDSRPRLSSRKASATPVLFRDVLIFMAESAYKSTNTGNQTKGWHVLGPACNTGP
jgi:hypothetical protein